MVEGCFSSEFTSVRGKKEKLYWGRLRTTVNQKLPVHGTNSTRLRTQSLRAPFFIFFRISLRRRNITHDENKPKKSSFRPSSMTIRINVRKQNNNNLRLIAQHTAMRDSRTLHGIFRAFFSLSVEKTTTNS